MMNIDKEKVQVYFETMLYVIEQFLKLKVRTIVKILLLNTVINEILHVTEF